MLRIVVVVALAAVPARAASKEEDRKIPDAVKAALEKADHWELLSLDPDRSQKPADGGFHGWKVLGKTLVKDKDARKTLLSALEKGVKENRGVVADCFIPRHGIRVVHNKKTYDLVICFQCYQVQEYT